MDYDVIIIGGGPAGLTAALYAGRARLKTLLIESFSVPSQAIMPDCVENYPGFPEGVNGFELMDKFKKQAGKFGTEFKAGDVKNIEEHSEKDIKGWKIWIGDKVYSSLALIIASGARPKTLNIKGEDRLKGKGVSYCATCDAPFFKDKDVVLVGGGDTAVEEALFLTKFGRKVTLVHRRDRLRAAKVLQERLSADKKVEFIGDSVLTEILGEGKVSAVRLKNIKTEKENTLSCDGVFVFIGYSPNTDFVKGLLKLDEKGYIIADGDAKTEKGGIFACGDCRRKILRQIVTACGDGAVAAFSAQQYVEELKGVAYK